MNRSKIEYVDHTWNPITGCHHECPYCYAKSMTSRFSGDVRLNKMAKKDYAIQDAADGNGKVYVLDKPMLNETGHALVYPFGFEPTLHRYRLTSLNKLKMGNNIFVGAMADVFGNWVPDDWISEIMAACMKQPIHNYLFLTKNPERYVQYGVPAGYENFWYGTSITKESEMERFNSLPAGCRTFVSLEPILEDLQPSRHNILFQQVGWIIIGAETGRRKGKIIPNWDWVKRIVLLADSCGVPVFMKDSLLNIVGEKNMRREFPLQMQLQHKKISEKMKNRLYNTCCICKAQYKKNEMIALCARSQRGEQPKQFSHICQTCFRKMCSKYQIEVPPLAGLKE